MGSADAPRIPEADIERFVRDVFEKLGVPPATAALATRSMLDASLLGVDTHGVEALDMYVEHLRGGGLDPKPEPVIVREKGSVGLWDMQSGFGLAGARKIMAHAIERAREHGLYFATCRRTNHIGACGIYGLAAAERGMIAMVGQQSRAAFAPWGGREPRIGPSPMAFVAPVDGLFPFYYDASFAVMTMAQVKAHIRAGKPLPEGVGLDAQGNPTTDPQKVWNGQILPIGRHKGVGMAMVNEVLHSVLSGNITAGQIPSIVATPQKSADSSIFIWVLDPEAIMSRQEFAQRMRRYVDYVESSPARDPHDPPRYPGRREGETWADRRAHGIPLHPDGAARLRKIADSLGLRFP